MKQVEVTEIKKLKHMGNPIKLQVSDFTLNASFVDWKEVLGPVHTEPKQKHE